MFSSVNIQLPFSTLADVRGMQILTNEFDKQHQLNYHFSGEYWPISVKQ